LRGGERRWVIEFEDFRGYEVKVAKEELVDVKTSTSKYPISGWVITGLRESPSINVGQEEKFISVNSIPLYW
jgi:hypothetical protein